MVAVLTAVRDLGRLREISMVLVRHGFGEIVARAGFGRARKETSEDIPGDELARGDEEKRRISLEERARLVLEDLGPTFIKLGQIVSTRADTLPAGVIVELKKLQDAVPPAPFGQIKEVVEPSLGAPRDELYVRFDP